MALKRVDVFRSADPNFNTEVAKKVYDLVMKMDRDTAEVFVYTVTADLLEEDIEKNERALQQHLERVVAKRTAMVKRAVAKRAAEDPEAALPYAQALALITKADDRGLFGGELAAFNEAHQRGTGGRFRTMIRSNPSVEPIKGKAAASIGIAEPNKKLTREQRSRYQQEYLQLANFLSAVTDSTGGDTEVRLNIQDKQGRNYVKTLNGTKLDADTWDPTTENVIHAEARSKGMNIGGASFGLTSALGASDDTATNVARGMKGLGDQADSFSRTWTEGPGDPAHPNARTYNRIAAGSKLLGAVAPGSPQAQIASQFGMFVGQYGPQAEAVIGPTARRTAYRYRGVERKPDASLVDAYAHEVNSNKQRNRSYNVSTPMQMAQARVSAERSEPTWDEREGGRRSIEDYLMDRGKRVDPEKRKVAPSDKLYSLQLEAGNTPPSEGVMLNAQGQIVAQAVGYGDDHYLPFNLKHLKSLKGGEYIRSRSRGGLTSEDIYTGLMSGARQVTVVSRSGTFTMKFEDDFRGGRRHNDKAKRMVRRYEALLDAVQSEKVDRQQLDPQVRRQIEIDVKNESGGFMNRADMQKEVMRRVEEFKQNPDVTPADEEIAERVIARESAGDPRLEATIRAKVYEQIRDAKEYKFRLNGEGYKAAQEALQEQFPYYINTRYVPANREEERKSFQPDKGYVKPGALRPTSAQIGLHAHSNKISGDRFNNQRASATKTEETAEVKAGEAPKLADARAGIAEQKQKLNYVRAATSLAAVASTAADFSDPESQRVMSFTADDLARPENQAAFDRVVAQMSAPTDANGRAIRWSPEVTAAIRDYKIAAGHVGQADWDASRAGVWGSKPMRFPEPGYQPGATEALKRGATNGLKSAISVLSDKNLMDLDESELHGEHTALTQVKNFAQGEYWESLEPKEKADLFKDIGLDPESRGTKQMIVSLEKNPGIVDKMIENVHRARALKALEAPVTQIPAVAPGAPATTIIHNAQTPVAERTPHQERVTKFADALENLSQHLEESNDPEDEEKANKLWHYARGLRDDVAKVHTEDDAKDLIMRDSEIYALFGAEAHKRRQVAGA